MRFAVKTVHRGGRGVLIKIEEFSAWKETLKEFEYSIGCSSASSTVPWQVAEGWKYNCFGNSFPSVNTDRESNEAYFHKYQTPKNKSKCYFSLSL